MSENNISSRDLYIDFARGICIIAIVFIHTVFWSGQAYTPLYIQNLALMVDVPLFFFLTGCTIAQYPKFNPIKQIYKLIIIFFLTVLVCQIIFFDLNLQGLLSPLFLASANVKKVCVLGGSYWFVTVYSSAIIGTKIILDYFKKEVVLGILVLIPLFYCYTFFCNKTYLQPSVLCGVVNAQLFLFYLWLVILGCKTYNFNKKYIWIGLSVVSLIFLLIFNLTISDFWLQKFKLPTNLPYIIASMVSIGITMACKCRMNNNFVVWLGQKAIYFYVAQGISSSILFSIVKRITELNWGLKLTICFGANLAMAIAIGFLIYIIEPKLSSLFIKKQEEKEKGGGTKRN